MLKIGWSCSKPWYLHTVLHDGTHKFIDFDCKQWSCFEHQLLLKKRWFSRLDTINWSLMITLTLVPIDKHLEQKAWSAFARMMKNKYSLDTFVKVIEVGSKTGMRHLHCLFAGKNFKVKDGRSWTIRDVDIKEKAYKYGFGKVLHIRPVDGNSQSINYLLKYLMKDVENEKYDPKTGEAYMRERERKLTTSRNIPSFKTLHEFRQKIKARSSHPDNPDHPIYSTPIDSRIVDDLDITAFDRDYENYHYGLAKKDLVSLRIKSNLIENDLYKLEKYERILLGKWPEELKEIVYP